MTYVVRLFTQGASGEALFSDSKVMAEREEAEGWLGWFAERGKDAAIVVVPPGYKPKACARLVGEALAEEALPQAA